MSQLNKGESGGKQHRTLLAPISNIKLSKYVFASNFMNKQLVCVYKFEPHIRLDG